MHLCQTASERRYAQNSYCELREGVAYCYYYDMKKQTLHDLAKFAAGLVVGDFLGIWWLAMNGGSATFLGFQFTSNMITPALLFDASLFMILIHYGWNIGKTPFLRERSYLLLAAIVFGIIALAHLIRSFTGSDIVLFGWYVPLWLSWIGTAVTAYLSYMSLHLAMRMR